MSRAHSDLRTARTDCAGPSVTGVAAVKLLASLTGPLIAGGVIARRRTIMPILERRQTDADVVATVAELRSVHGAGPLQLHLPGRRVALPLVAADVARILHESPEHFAPANREKIAALSPFQPHGLLVSRGAMRTPRRTFNEDVLDTDRPLHHLAGAITTTIAAETRALAADAALTGTLDAASFIESWWGMVRSIVLGAAARDDEAVTDDLWTLRSVGNRSYLRPNRRRLRERFLDQLYRYVDAADPLSVAGAVAATRPAPTVDPVGQIPHWLFAFDAAAIVTLRALALLAAHPEAMKRARREVGGADLSEPHVLPYLQACVLESVRLWPTTPAILRDSLTKTSWGSNGERFDIGPGAAFLILAGAFHRDPTTVPFADTFTPQAWLDGRAQLLPGVVPFSAGPARCPGENLVLFIASMTLANVLSELGTIDHTSAPSFSAKHPLPATINHYSINLAVHR
ncbi:hypothetical protein CH293_03000 [Rhodococcus sp. 14-2470-1b]|uniref:cytochrome P450 n=1 Tax=Rhodococcus sp. 14-2470-1b TaxID=2023149 RepID=UPI000B9AC79E|nr:cytochrome P450 [Rhodococcus sp. 14-2470-1b]OZF57693.1 hypothetical protein CH293_03000 [Rhodococcus sp. 14-2470-1b]